MIKINIVVNTRAVEMEVAGLEKSQYKSAQSPAGIELIEAFQEYLRNTHRDLLLSRFMCGEVLLGIGHQSETTTVKMIGMHIKHRMPVEITVSNEDIQKAIPNTMDQLIKNISGYIRTSVQAMEPFRMDNAQIILGGEFRHLHGLRSNLEKAIGIPVIVDE